MDANRLRFWMLAGERPWSPEPLKDKADPPAVAWHEERRIWRLASGLGDPPWQGSAEVVAPDVVLPLVLAVPGAVDRFGTYAFAETNGIFAGGAGPSAEGILNASDVSGLAAGYDDILYAALGEAVALVDLRLDAATRGSVKVGLDGFSAWRVCALPSGGALALGGPVTSEQIAAGDTTCAIARISGRQLPVAPPELPPDIFGPQAPNPDPPRMSPLLKQSFPGETAVAIASSPGGKVAVLFWSAPTDGDLHPPARIRLLGPNGLGDPITLGVSRPTSLAWLAEDRVAVLFRIAEPKTKAAKAVVLAYTGMPGMDASALGEYYPVPATAGHFLQGTTLPPHYDPGTGNRPTPLHPVSLPSYHRAGILQNTVDAEEGLGKIDAGDPEAVWHRLYLEAMIPPRCGLRVWLSATNTEARPGPSDEVWHEHLFGDIEPSSDEAVDVPRGAWIPLVSEVPFHEGLLSGDAAPERKGLFMALVQRANRKVRSLRGRYLWARVELLGDGRATPELAALRVYGSRFSYLNNYLPEFYREQRFGSDAEEAGSATPADFLERFLGLAEGILTPIEDRIANAFALTDPRKVPEGAFDWLASFIGFSFDPIIPADRRRALLQAAPAIRKWHGTLRGFRLALDAVTGGAVSRGAIVLVEDFKLRRTFSTILGADLDRDEDPLLPGLYASGNSYVGDTLFLGEDGKKEFLALFGADIAQTAAEREAAQRFFDDLAHRVTVLAHEGLDRKELGLIRRVAELEAPAHVQVAVSTATQPFMVAVASLVGVDTFLGPPDKPGPVRVGKSALGLHDMLLRPPSLDPRLESAEEVLA